MFFNNQNSWFEIYRVRKSAHDIKSQTGAYLLLECAIKKARETQCNVYDKNFRCVYRCDSANFKK